MFLQQATQRRQGIKTKTAGANLFIPAVCHQFLPERHAAHRSVPITVTRAAADGARLREHARRLETASVVFDLQRISVGDWFRLME